jgi:uncharacterized protein YktB (UPF0637 family)
MPDLIAGTIQHIRLIVDAIASGRVEARTVKEMTDEQLGEYVARLRDEARAEVTAGYALHEPKSEE